MSACVWPCSPPTTLRQRSAMSRGVQLTERPYAGRFSWRAISAYLLVCQMASFSLYLPQPTCSALGEQEQLRGVPADAG
eukprot:4094152-Pyramimonas_sp.AAC.1